MANIREYAPQLAAPDRPLNPAADPGAAMRAGAAQKEIGGALGQFGQTLFNIAEQNDATTAQVEIAKARADFTAQLQRAKETGEAADPEYVQSVQNRAGEAAAQIADKMQTRTGANIARAYGAQFASGMQTMAIQDNASAIGERAKQLAMDTQNINRNTLRASPEQFQIILGETLNQLDGPAYAHIDAGLREQIKIQAKASLALSAMEGVIHMRSPEEAKQILDSGKMDGFLTADNKRALYAEAEQAVRGREAEAERLRRQQELLAEKEREVTKDNFVAQMNTANGNQLAVKEVLQSNLLSNEKEHFIAMMKDNAQRKIQDDPGTVNTLFRRIHLPDGDPNKIVGDDELFKYFGRGVGFEGLNHLRGELKQDPFGEAYSDASATAYRVFRGSKPGTVLPEVAEAAALQWRIDAKKAIEQARVEKKNPRDLFTPGSKEYLLSPERLSTYMKLSNVVVFDKVQAMSGPPEVGDVVGHGDGKFKFTGGDPADASSWAKVN